LLPPKQLWGRNDKLSTGISLLSLRLACPGLSGIAAIFHVRWKDSRQAGMTSMSLYL